MSLIQCCCTYGDCTLTVCLFGCGVMIGPGFVVDLYHGLVFYGDPIIDTQVTGDDGCVTFDLVYGEGDYSIEVTPPAYDAPWAGLQASYDVFCPYGNVVYGVIDPSDFAVCCLGCAEPIAKTLFFTCDLGSCVLTWGPYGWSGSFLCTFDNVLCATGSTELTVTFLCALDGYGQPSGILSFTAFHGGNCLEPYGDPFNPRDYYYTFGTLEHHVITGINNASWFDGTACTGPMGCDPFSFECSPTEWLIYPPTDGFGEPAPPAIPFTPGSTPPLGNCIVSEV
jgi:hypothetical protein